jgi:hypothetical protein
LAVYRNSRPYLYNWVGIWITGDRSINGLKRDGEVGIDRSYLLAKGEAGLSRDEDYQLRGRV